ncbi:MAG: tRNA cyclic N6-threonylcarbamoyladenosine(37) synthase TcdA, partial [Gammaproteobacteria bacterium]
QSHVCVIGVGGVGSWAAEALARSGIGEITLIDLDNVAESNVNRQIHAVDGEFGKAKITAMRERIFLINPQCKVNEIEDFVTIENIPEMVDQKYDFIIDCIDNFRTKAALIAYCRSNKYKLITIGGAGGQVDPTKVKISDLSKTKHDGLLSQVRKLLRQEYGFSRNLKRRFYIACVYSEEQLVYPTSDGEICAQKPDNANASGLNCEGGFGSAMTVTAAFGMAAVSYVLKKLST